MTAREAIEGIIAGLLVVSPAMLEAGSKAMLEAATIRAGKSYRPRPGVTADQELSAVWQAMAAAKLAEWQQQIEAGGEA